MWLKIASNQMDIFQDSLYYLGLYKAKPIKFHHFYNTEMCVYAPQGTEIWSLFSYHDGFPRAKRKLLNLFWQNVLSCLSFPFWSNIAVWYISQLSLYWPFWHKENIGPICKLTKNSFVLTRHLGMVKSNIF